jgi:hypothetical protein
MTKKGYDLSIATSLSNRAVTEVCGLEALLYRFKRNIVMLGRDEILALRSALIVYQVIIFHQDMSKDSGNVDTKIRKLCAPDFLLYTSKMNQIFFSRLQKT